MASIDRYVPRLLLSLLAMDGAAAMHKLEGTMVYADVSGFTRLSERLARIGKEGAELLVEAINMSFTALLADAWTNGGELIKFGGDALLLWFDGDDHLRRGVASAVAMRRRLSEVGRITAGGTRITLRMSVGIHSGGFEFFVVGSSHRELVAAGPGATAVVEMEAAANTGQIVLSPMAASGLPPGCLGPAVGPGVVLTRGPSCHELEPKPAPEADPETLAECLPSEVRALVLAGGGAPEHRTATVAFLQFEGFDHLIARRGGAAAARPLDELVRVAQDAAEAQEVCLIDSDIGRDGGKLRFTAGAPRAAGEDEERMLLALRHVIESDQSLPVRIGVNRGPVFSGEIGPEFRRTYAVMGDTVNLAARVMAKAPIGHIYSTRGVIDRSQTRFDTYAIEPFAAKGKRRLVEVWDVGRARRSSGLSSDARTPPLIGRERELGVIEKAVADAQAGSGSLIDISGDAGSGKSRLLREARRVAHGMRLLSATCGQLTRSTPYSTWRDLLRQLVGLRWEDPDDVVVAAIRSRLERDDPGLLPWMSLLAIAFDVESAGQLTREVAELSPDFRAAKLHEVVLRFIASELRIPTLIQIEQAHLMDAASAALFGAVAVELGMSAWAVMITRREQTGGFQPAGGLAAQLRPGPLSRVDSTALAEATAEANRIPPHLLELAVARSGGSAGFLLDLLAAAAAGSGALPESIEAAASARIDALGPSERTLVRRAAVLGGSFHLNRLEVMLGQPPAGPDDPIWERLAGILRRGEGDYIRFERPALREVAYQGLPYSTRRALHRTVGIALERDLGVAADAEPDALSLHFLLAGDHLRTWRYALMAAERANARFAHADAARLFRRAIEVARPAGAASTELAAVWEGLGEALRRAGQRKAASDAFARARELLSYDQIAQARLCFRQADVAERAERITSAVRWINRGLRALENDERDDATRWRARLLAELAGYRHRQGDPQQAVATAQRALNIAESVNEHRAIARASYVLDQALVDCGRPHEATHSPRALEIYRALGDPERESAVLNNLGSFAYFRGDWDGAIDWYRQQAERSERAGNPADVAFTDCNIGEILSDQGRWDEAVDHLKRARRVWSATGDVQAVAFANALLGRAAVRSGQVEEGRAMLEQAEAELRGFGLHGYADFVACLVCEAHALGGDADLALRASEPLLQSADRYVPLLRRARGMAFGRLGERDAAIRELERALVEARTRAADYDIAATLDALELMAGHDPLRARERDLIAARLHVERMPAPVPAPGAKFASLSPITASASPALAP